MQEKTLSCGYTRPFREASDAGKKDHTFKMNYDILIVAVRQRAPALLPTACLCFSLIAEWD